MNSRFSLGVICLIGALACVEGVSWLMHRVEPGPNRFLWIGLFSQGVWIFLALAGALFAAAAPVRERLGLGPNALSRPATLLLVAGFAAFSHGLYVLLGAHELRQTGALAQVERGVAAATSQGPSLLLAILAFGLAPGVAEELLFRGLIQRGLARRSSSTLAVAGAAALFALAHGDPVHSGAAFALGIYLGCVAQIAGSIRPAIACHVLNNGLGIAAVGIGRGLGLGLPQGPAAGWALIATGAALALGVGWRAVAARAQCHPRGDAGTPDQAGRADRRLRDSKRFPR